MRRSLAVGLSVMMGLVLAVPTASADGLERCGRLSFEVDKKALFVTGTSGSDSFTIEFPELRVFKRTGDSSYEWITCTPAGWKKGLTVSSAEGDDHIFLGALKKGDISIDTGPGNDTVGFGWPVAGVYTPHFVFGGDVTLETGTGYDGVSGRTVDFKGKVSIHTGEGGEHGEWVSFEYSVFRKELVIDESDAVGSNGFVFLGTTEFKKDVSVHFADGDDRFYLYQSRFEKELWADGSTGFDTVFDTDNSFKKAYTFSGFELID